MARDTWRRESLRANAPIARNTWFGVGGLADYLFKPEDTAELAAFLKENTLPVTVIGVGSNLLIRDGGVEGVVVRLGRGFTELHATRNSQLATLQTGAACLDVNVARFAAEQGIAGLEFLSGIPGTIGGAVRMNAGAYGREMAQVVESVEVVLPNGELRVFSNEECGFRYRASALPEGAIVTRAWLKGEAGEVVSIQARIEEIQRAREETQPIRSKTGGSTFKNPPGHKAWELIDRAGCRGLTQGGAQVSEKHCNFLINTGDATASDLENLGEEVRKRVKALTGVELEWEIKRIGRMA